MVRPLLASCLLATLSYTYALNVQSLSLRAAGDHGAGAFVPPARSSLDREGAASDTRADSAALSSLAMSLHRTMSENWNAPAADLRSICTVFHLSSPECDRLYVYANGSLGSSTAPINVKANFSKPGDLRNDKVMALKVGDLLDANQRGVDMDWGELQGGLDIQQLVRNCTQCKAFYKAGLLVSFGDSASLGPCFPMFKKIRLLDRTIVHGNDNEVLLPLNTRRHWGPVKQARAVDIPYSEKEDKLLWRGVSTGFCKKPYHNDTRIKLMDSYGLHASGKIDVGFTKVVQNCGDDALPYKKKEMSYRDMLKSKFLLVVNGNDKASALNWILYSNSVPFMVTPRFESWLVESALRPWVHYVPIEPDFSDLESKVDWAIANPDEAKRIAMEGQLYVRAFMDPRREMVVEAALLTAYLQRVKVTEVEHRRPHGWDGWNGNGWDGENKQLDKLSGCTPIIRSASAELNR